MNSLLNGRHSIDRDHQGHLDGRYRTYPCHTSGGLFRPFDNGSAIANGNTSDKIHNMTVTLSITVDDDLGRDLAEAVSGGNRSALVAQAVREYLDRRNIAAAAAWHASLTGDDAAALADFDASW